MAALGGSSSSRPKFLADHPWCPHANEKREGKYHEGRATAVSEAIAVVGLGCIYPGAHSPEELWVNVLAGRRFFRKAPPERMPAEYFDPDPQAPDKSYCDRMAVITGWEFDPLQFRIPPVTVRTSDIAHWLALHTADLALKDAGLDLASLDHTRAGVMLGNSLTGEFSRAHNLRLRWPYIERALRRSLQAQGMDEPNIHHILTAFRQSHEAPFPEANEDTLAGNMSNTIAGRVCNHFDFGGGGFTVDGACSSSLLGVVLACDALVKGDLDVALAGGVDVSLDPFEIVGFAKTQALAKEDIRPYDERAGGMLTGEGCGIFVLMREADARARGLKIHALLKGWAYSSDGKGGITAPEVDGQARALRRAYERAGYPMSAVGYIEGHGTGTPLGDKVELTAIHRVLQSDADSPHCTIGSIKANIGHCKAAAGAAGLIKAIQALKHKILPPTVNCERPIKAFSESGGKLRPSLTGKAWESNGAPRRASVSSMGFGGANSHVTIEEANPDDSASAEHLTLLGSHQSSELILLSAADTDGLVRQVRQLLPIAERICHAELTDLSAALAKRATVGALRLAIVAVTPWELAGTFRHVAAQLESGAALETITDAAAGIFAGTTVQNPTLALLFPGQGSQRLNMGARLCERYPFAREIFARVDGEVSHRIFRDMPGVSPEQAQTWNTQLKATEIAQPAIVAASAATLSVLDFLGLRPAFAIGHSLGEITALHAAGAMDAAQAVRIAALRGKAMAALGATDTGAMLAIAAEPARVQSLLPGDGSVVISNFNSPRQTVVSGRTPAIHALKARCAREQLRTSLLPVSHAFHSDLVAPAAADFSRALESIPFAPLRADAAKVVSTATGGELPADCDLRALLGGHIRQPVRFVEAVQTAAARRPDLWIEAGPGGVLTALVRDILGPDKAVCLPTDLPGDDTHHLLNLIVARAFVLGFPVRPENLFAHRFHRPFDPENYHPVFITNPCERPVTLDVERLASFGVPASAGPDRLKAELQTAQTVPPPAAATPDAANDKDSLLTFAINWIAKRTGFPPSVIGPDKRLRDDLNLDSIKVGELVVLLARQASRSFKGDPTAFANATPRLLVDALLAQESEGAAQTAGAAVPKLDALPVAGLGDWVHTFRMAHAPAPIATEPPRPALGAGIILVAENETPRVVALAAALAARGITTTMATADSLVQTPRATDSPSSFILLLPDENADFHSGTSAQFDERTEGLATRLLRFFQWALPAHDADAGFRALVVRPAHDPDAAGDLDAGAAFVKSLQLETPAAQVKWLTLPAEWSAERWAETALQELACSGRSSVRHAADGERTADVAHPCDAAEPGAPLTLSADDVAFVTGGGKGITFELALALARHTGCKLALAGSSPLPDAGELPRNLARLREAGIAHAYFQADVTDGDAVRRAVGDAERQLGKVTAILHGAGVSHFRSLREKTRDEFLRCLRIKARGLFNLLAAVPPARLKALHVISSVLGSTGMRGQTDYTFANAWLDEAVRRLQSVHPRLHCLSLGYSVWAETGLGQQAGVVDSLRSAGITPVSIAQGVAAYRRLLTARPAGSKFVITGRLSPDLDAHLHGAWPTWHRHPACGASGLPACTGTGETPVRPTATAVPQVPRRFLEKIRRWIPGAEIIADATLSHATDLYLPEHVFEGTPMFPGVLAMEAMVQAAMACAGRDELPVLRNIVFRRPLIVPEDATVVVRTLALAEVAEGGTQCVRVAMRSDADDFHENHFEAECWFGLPVPDSLPACPSFVEILPVSPEDFNPVPLFQGKLFRRITAVRKMERERECHADILVPGGERYFGAALPQDVAMPSPAMRDAFLQTGALVLPHGTLPEGISEWRVLRRALPGENLRCSVRIWPVGENAFDGQFHIYDELGEVIEFGGGMFRHSGKPPSATNHGMSSVPLERVAADLAELLPETPGALAFVAHDSLTEAGGGDFSAAEKETLRQKTAPARFHSALANLAAARRAGIEVAARSLQLALLPQNVRLAHDAHGKPALEFADTTHAQLFAGMEISLADGHGLSVAWVGPVPVGVDIEIVEARDCETWRGLLGDDGYALALKIERETREPFDAAATRVWTLLEAGRKAFSLRRVLPRFTGSAGGDWLAMSVEADGGACRLLSALVKNSEAKGGVFAIAVAVGNKMTPEAKTTHEMAMTDSNEEMKRLGFDTDSIAFGCDYSGPQGQIVMINRFPVTFRACKTATKKVSFTNYASWAADVREFSILPVFDELTDVFGTGAFGAATNYFKVEILGEASPGDTIEARMWVEYGYGTHDEVMCLKCDWSRIDGKKTTTRVALSEMGFSWVKIVGHGVAKVEPLPKKLRAFLDGMLPRTDTVKPLEPLPCGYEHLQPGPLLWQGTGLADGKPALFRHEILTTSENSNWVGNIYFANYGEWMARVRDLYFHRLTPDCFRHAGRDGEWVCRSCAIDHLSEAMPFDRILVTMDVAAIHRSGVDLTFDYFLLENDRIARKLAHGTHTMLWVGRDARHEPVALDLPRKVVETLMREVR